MCDDDFDWNAYGKAMKEAGKERRANNRDKSAQLLRDRGILFESKNGGAHLIVDAGETKIDFWPGTGKWVSRSGRKGRGVFNLLKELN